VSTVYDAGLLAAADRNDRAVWAEHKARLQAGTLPLTTAPVVAQVSRTPQQTQLHRLLRGCEILPFDVRDAHPVGELLARAATADVVDAHLVHRAPQGATIHTSDPNELRRLANRLGKPITLRRT
jgi:hypothetical protein